jgi:hypothetical protein
VADFDELNDEGSVSRQGQINALEVGSSIAAAERIDLTFGINPEALAKTTRLIRGSLDKQANRARRQTGGVYTVENGSYLTASGAIVVVCTVTRTE